VRERSRRLMRKISLLRVRRPRAADAPPAQALICAPLSHGTGRCGRSRKKALRPGHGGWRADRPGAADGLPRQSGRRWRYGRSGIVQNARGFHRWRDRRVDRMILAENAVSSVVVWPAMMVVGWIVARPVAIGEERGAGRWRAPTEFTRRRRSDRQDVGQRREQIGRIGNQQELMYPFVSVSQGTTSSIMLAQPASPQGGES